MSNPNIAAEIIPQPDQAQHAAKALQKLGFRVLQIGETVSVQAPAEVWKKTFDVSFAKESKKRLSISPRSTIEYAVPKGTVRVPESLGTLISDVHFVQPPELF